MKNKNWVVNYSIKKAGTVMELELDVEACSIACALYEALRVIRKKHPDIEDLSIWAISIVEEDVF